MFYFNVIVILALISVLYLLDRGAWGLLASYYLIGYVWICHPEAR